MVVGVGIGVLVGVSVVVGVVVGIGVDVSIGIDVGMAQQVLTVGLAKQFSIVFAFVLAQYLLPLATVIQVSPVWQAMSPHKSPQVPGTGVAVGVEVAALVGGGKGKVGVGVCVRVGVRVGVRVLNPSIPCC